MCVVRVSKIFGRGVPESVHSKPLDRNRVREVPDQGLSWFSFLGRSLRPASLSRQCRLLITIVV